MVVPRPPIEGSALFPKWYCNLLLFNLDAGLGLVISAKLAAAMGGRMWVDSEEGKGSKFGFTAKFKLSPALEGQTSIEPNSLQVRSSESVVHNKQMQ